MTDHTHPMPCPSCGRLATWEAVESYGECDDCFGGEHPDQIAAEDRLIVECRRLGHPLIIGGTCICGKRIG